MQEQASTKDLNIGTNKLSEWLDQLIGLR